MPDEMTGLLAETQLGAIIDNCGEILNAAQAIKDAIKIGDVEKMRAGLKVIEDATERDQHRITVGAQPGAVYELIREIEIEAERGN